MKNLMQNFKNYPLFLGLFFLSISVTSCDDDDDGDIIDPGSEATISAQAQVVSQNMVLIDNIMLDEDAWLVVKKVNDDGSYSDLIAEPMLLEEGNHTDILVELKYSGTEDIALESGDTIIFQLHRDDGDGVFEFSGDTGEDKLLKDSLGSAIHEEIVITAPTFTISDQTVMDNSVTFDNITVANNGWIVVHNSHEDGSINEADIVGYTYVPMGSTDDVVVTFDEEFIYVPGQTIYTKWYLDDPADEVFTFLEDPLTDVADFFGFGDDNTIWDSIVIE
ncbi:MAG TPA: hypothetical protein VFM59_03965 [Salinimicrobium sp.]|nr:hypothetical protein [Salinimicrobium sp.]